MNTLRHIYTSTMTAVVLTATLSGTTLAQGVRSGVEAARGEGQPSDLFIEGGIFQELVNVFLFVIGAVAVIMVIYGGLRYVLSGGNAANVTAAKNTILYAIVGIIVALLAYAIIDFVIDAFSAGGTTGL